MAWNAAAHPRVPKGSPGGGQFGTAKGKAPAPSKKPAKNGNRYTKAQFAELQSLQRQHAAGKKLTKAQAHALHVAHELHMQHVKAVKIKRAAKPKTAPKRAKRKSGGPRRAR